MNRLFNFDDLIDRHSCEIRVKYCGRGEYVHGRFVADDSFYETRFGAVLPMSVNKIHSSGGYLTSADKQLITRTPIGDTAEDIRVEFGGREYKVEQDTDYGAYADIYQYILKWVEINDRCESH